jgi:Domain of unknown function (DUF4926)
MNLPPMLATVALLEDIPQHDLTRGEMGTVVEHLAAGNKQAVLVEFADDDGQTYALLPLRPEQVVVLHGRLRAA